MGDMDWHKIDRMLTEDIQRLENMIAKMCETNAGISMDDADELTRADAIASKGRLTTVMDTLTNRLRGLRLALERVRTRDPEYGYCSECGEPIGIARLLAVPESVLCVDCASGKSAAY